MIPVRPTIHCIGAEPVQRLPGLWPDVLGRPSLRSIALILAWMVAPCFATAIDTGVDGPRRPLDRVGHLTIPPWEIWQDPALLPVLDVDDQVLMRSSHCPDGCRYDRHDPFSPRFLRIDDEEAVIFEDVGPGAITRIWMTTGADAISRDLPADVGIRIWIDDHPEPVVDLPLPHLFSGRVPPFVPPLVADRSLSSGGNLCMVPIPYRSRCRVALIGAETTRLWYQLTYHRLSDANRVQPFDRETDLQGLRSLVGQPGSDPWRDESGVEKTTGVTLAPGSEAIVALNQGPGIVTAIRVRGLRSKWSTLRLVMSFDGAVTVDLPLTEPRATPVGSGPTTSSTMVGFDGAHLYCYWPMPHQRQMEMTLVNGGPAPAAAEVTTRVLRRPPLPGSGLFTAIRTVIERTRPNLDTIIAELDGQGKWVGLLLEIGSVDGGGRSYLEGDERIYVDGGRHPALYGTGVEDFFGGGFYFRVQDLTPVPFQLGLNGLLFDEQAGSDTIMAMYRLMLTDAPTFTSSIRAGLESGATGEDPMRLHATAFLYHLPTPAMHPVDLVNLGNEASRTGHAYTAEEPKEIRSLASAFEGEPPLALTAEGIYRSGGTAEMTMAGVRPGAFLRVRRLFDALNPGPEAVFLVNGEAVAVTPTWPASPERRWREQSILLGRAPADTSGTIRLGVQLRPTPQGPAEIGEFLYELWTETE